MSNALELWISALGAGSGSVLAVDAINHRVTAPTSQPQKPECIRSFVSKIVCRPSLHTYVLIYA